MKKILILLICFIINISMMTCNAAPVIQDIAQVCRWFECQRPTIGIPSFREEMKKRGINIVENSERILYSFEGCKVLDKITNKYRPGDSHYSVTFKTFINGKEYDGEACGFVKLKDRQIDWYYICVPRYNGERKYNSYTGEYSKPEYEKGQFVNVDETEKYKEIMSEYCYRLMTTYPMPKLWNLKEQNESIKYIYKTNVEWDDCSN